MKKFFFVTHWFVFIFYSVLLMETVFFSRDTYRNVNMVPFDMINSQGFSLNVWGNILMFVPLGMYAAYYMKKVSIAKVMLFVISASMFIEVVQYIFARGATDIDDLILNTTGGAMGLAFYLILVKLCQKRERANFAVQVLATIVGLTIFGLTATIFMYNQ